MIILRNNSHGGIIRVCMGIFMTALRNKTILQILNKNISPYFHSVSLVIWPLTLMERTHFSELSISRFSTYMDFSYVRRKPRNWNEKCVLFINWNVKCVLPNTRGIGISLVSGSLSHVSLNTHSKMCEDMIWFWARCRYRDKSSK